MKRAAWLLALLLSVWLLALPSARVPAVAARPASVLAHDGKATQCVEHVVQPSTLARVQPAPLWARLPASPWLVAGAHAIWSRGVAGVCSRAPDLRAALRRVITRSRVPRLGAEDPPWS